MTTWRALVVLLLLCGCGQAWAIELTSDTLPPLPDPLGVAGPFVGVDGDAVIVAGGANFAPPVWEAEKAWHDAIWVLLARGQEAGPRWLAGGQLERPLGYGVSVSTSKGVVCGGGNDATTAFAAAFLLTWNDHQQQVEQRPLPPLPQPSAYGSAAAIGDTVYVAAGTPSASLADATPRFWSLDLSGDDASRWVWQELPAWPDFSLEPPAADLDTAAADTDEDDDLWDGPQWRLPNLQLPAMPALADLPRWTLPAAGGAVLVIALGGWLLLRPRTEPAQPIPVQPAEQAQPPAAPPTPPAPVAPSFPLTAADPSETQLQELLEAWLEAKAAVLAGGTAPLPLSDLARSSQVALLQRQEQANRSAGATETVKASVESFSVSERSPNRIAAQVTLRYSDERRSSSGAVLSQTPSTSLTNTYVFARDGERWLLAAFKPG